ncbi:YusG family protein [Alkalihalobacillus hemicellulosilyticus]|uniref:DUF2553 domain-containing protein n=1 Tax=Halalkalibacter hemicellulosilyticusJCM 9152 TaxID=1236971 RepID=W4QDZ5_9BACI|nr:YusG family protein [Halalkalibacter hemicellulosilyticus]GAE30276.1 hypothetical protein JCM9152_1679 [Halalkalibacter hemicellulosilyticusJCM 9152]
MNLEFVKVDVTSQVKGKYEGGKLSLYMGEAKIGQVIETNQGLQHEMAEGFEFDEDKIYRYENKQRNDVQSYVENCDEGWC